MLSDAKMVNRLFDANIENMLSYSVSLTFLCTVHILFYIVLVILFQVDTASKQDLQRVRQAAWESELKRQAKPMKMLAIGCTWEDATTAIAAQQLETLLKFKVRMF